MTYSLNVAIGEELRLARNRKGLTRLDVTVRLRSGIQPQTLGNYERAERALTVNRFGELCDALGVDMCTVLRLAQHRLARLAETDTDPAASHDV